MKLQGDIGVKLRTDCKISVDGGKYRILSDRSIPSISIGPMIAMVLDILNSGYTINETIDILAKLMKSEREIIEKKLEAIIEITEPFIAMNNDFHLETNIDIKKYLKDIGIEKDTLEIIRKPFPAYLVFNLTDKCERRCIYCYEEAISIPKGKKVNAEIDVNRFRVLLKEAVDNGCSKFEIGGGDPFCICNIAEYLKVAMKSDMDFTISTKSFLSKGMCHEIREIGLKEIQISMDSHIEEIADMLMCSKNAYSEILETIKNLQDEKINIRLKMVVNKYNIEHIDKSIIFFGDKGIKDISFNLYGMSCGRHSKILYPTEKQIDIFESNILKLKNYINKSEMNLQYIPGMANEFYKRGNASLAYKTCMRGICASCTYSMTIRPNGDVVYCSFLSKHPDFVIGNILRESINSCWNSTKIKQLRNPERYRFKNTICYDCDLFDICKEKRCYLRSMVYKGTPYDIDPWCKYGDSNFHDY